MAKIDRRMARRRMKPAATGCAFARRAASRTFAANACARIGIRTAPHIPNRFLPGAKAPPDTPRRPFDTIASPQRMRNAHAAKPCKSDIQIGIDYFRSA
ncbi:hypothetical protein [Burkholderia sp. RF2-non_BP3]|uniref:hypothetical protein n=1 Tax=Burkholderia sp. RF2-non_BP3 TaxID=1637844 RepID=UPI000A8868DB|nr:hypothetical protein [Burkholderia sp. RF2-non_BP3]